jgi:peptidoglycan/xylan/chitin deacetylase (PgdA/CDA1 family)
MISTLRAHHAPAAVFVNCARLQRSDPLLDLWIASGATVGNHTAHHRDLHTTPIPEWQADVRSCDTTLRSITKKPVNFFRFPALHEGADSRQRQAAQHVLTDLHYRNAQVTIDNLDILAVRPYSEAIARGRSSEAERLIQAAVAHDLAATTHFEETARAKVGREIPQVILLHANLMTSAMLPTLLDSLQRRGYRFISIEAALSDSVFQRPECYKGSDGVSFLYRIAPCKTDDSAWDTAANRALRKAVTEARTGRAIAGGRGDVIESRTLRGRCRSDGCAAE